jgi:hypothetical protein
MTDRGGRFWESFVTWFLGAFGFASLPVLFEWLHAAKLSGLYSISELLGLSEIWIFGLVITSGVFLDEASGLQQQQFARWSIPIMIWCVLLGSLTSFEFAEALARPLPTSNASINPLWLRPETVFLIIISAFAIVCRLTRFSRLAIPDEATPT